MVFVVVLAAWLVLPLMLWGRLAQDAVPLIAAGRLARTNPEALYVPTAQDTHTVTPEFRRVACEAMPAGTDCDAVVVPFSHPPIILPVAVVVGALPDPVAVFVYRLVAAGALAGGMALLWRRLVRRSPDAAGALAASALLLTPYAVFTVTLGQSSALLFLSVCLGVSATRRTRDAAIAGGLWSATIAMKAFPAALALVAVAQRRVRLLVGAAGWCVLLVVLGRVVGGPTVFGDFLRSAGALRVVSFADPYNRGIDGVAHLVSATWTGDSVWFAVSMVVRVVLVGVLWWARLRHADADEQWAYGWVAVLLLVPIVWWHYFWVVVGAAFVMVAGRAARDPRWFRVLPAVAAVTVVETLIDGQSGSASVVDALLLGIAVVALPFLPAPKAASQRG